MARKLTSTHMRALGGLLATKSQRDITKIHEQVAKIYEQPTMDLSHLSHEQLVVLNSMYSEAFPGMPIPDSYSGGISSGRISYAIISTLTWMALVYFIVGVFISAADSPDSPDEPSEPLIIPYEPSEPSEPLIMPDAPGKPSEPLIMPEIKHKLARTLAKTNMLAAEKLMDSTRSQEFSRRFPDMIRSREKIKVYGDVLILDKSVHCWYLFMYYIYMNTCVNINPRDPDKPGLYLIAAYSIAKNISTEYSVTLVSAHYYVGNLKISERMRHRGDCLRSGRDLFVRMIRSTGLEEITALEATKEISASMGLLRDSRQLEVVENYAKLMCKHLELVNATYNYKPSWLNDPVDAILVKAISKTTCGLGPEMLYKYYTDIRASRVIWDTRGVIK